MPAVRAVHLIAPGSHRRVGCYVGVCFVDRDEDRENERLYSVQHFNHIASPCVVVEHLIVQFRCWEATALQVRRDGLSSSCASKATAVSTSLSAVKICTRPICSSRGIFKDKADMAGTCFQLLAIGMFCEVIRGTVFFVILCPRARILPYRSTRKIRR